MHFLKPFDRVRLQRGAEHLCRLGSRAVGEFIVEAAAASDDPAVVLDRLDRWRELDLSTLLVAGGDRWSPTLAVVPK
jgi:hypothetical protein